MADVFRTWIAALSPAQRDRFMAIWEEDERKMLEAANNAEDDATFVALFQKLCEMIAQRDTSNLQEQIVSAVGLQNAIALSKILEQARRSSAA